MPVNAEHSKVYVPFVNYMILYKGSLNEYWKNESFYL